MKKQTARLVSVSIGEDLTLSAAYSDGRKIHVDMRDVVERIASFAPLESHSEFTSAKVTDWGWTLEWDCGASLDSDRLLEMALEQSGMIDNVRFRRWMDANGLSLTEAASAIGITRRTVSQYRTGARPVPHYITLACVGWETLRNRKAA
jgi:DNA-binding XRE family transcriptional regulator